VFHWFFDSIFYHIYPLGLTGAPERNDFLQPPIPRLDQLHGWIAHLKALGINALYLGPLFESTAHGYDTADYYLVDRRLGTTETLSNLSAALHTNGIRLVLDGVFNHVGRDFWAFRDVQTRGWDSPYRDWFHNLRFDGRSPYNDPFTYEGWAGHYDLVKLNLGNPSVREHLFGAVAHWMDVFAIDGLRLDAADVIDPSFLQALAAFCRGRRPDFWLMGEIVHGDYRRLANPHMLDSVTNYECYKGLYSSLVDVNYFEIAYALNRQFGTGGQYRGLPLYNFADNHDVNRVASNLTKPAHLYPLYCLLFTMPGVPSIYYGSEWGLTGIRGNGNDRQLRPALDLTRARRSGSKPDLAEAIARLARVRHETPALRYGDYRQLFVSHEQLAFSRHMEGQQALVLLNASERPAAFDVPCVANGAHQMVDLLNPGGCFPIGAGHVHVDEVQPSWARILVAAP
jgi:cyclomaltodextrinase